MDPTRDPDVKRFRESVRDFLARHLPSNWAGFGALDPDDRPDFCRRWREVLQRNGYLGISWPREYGGAGLSILEQSVLQEEFARAGAPLLPMPNDSFGLNLIGPTLLKWGTEQQKSYFIPKILSGEHRWAQGYSEPEAGSDLFGLRTRAALEDGVWVVNGQKIWQTAGDTANWIFILARTEPDESRHRGLSMLLVPIDQPQVEVRPIRTMVGHHEFCEVFFSDATTSADNLVGPRGEGARVALTLLGYERGSASGAVYAKFQIELERLIELIRERGLADDPIVRDRLADCWSRLQGIRHLGLRILIAAANGNQPGPESSLFKLCTSEYHATVTEFALDVLGMDATVCSGAGAVGLRGADPLGSPNSPAAWQDGYLSARAGTIYGGSSQIQRNTIAEHVLGLPRDRNRAHDKGGRA
ncbi:acyl-CoA dehydrogenase family protein [Phytohabitans kaempferiae]|uniref:Acyl-CoA dehydrogenase family protein n=1 Tax=Phytohabitans kaempferiae TaxID=1620943 RepID=A0ABV6MGX7_9ACTN